MIEIGIQCDLMSDQIKSMKSTIDGLILNNNEFSRKNREYYCKMGIL